LAGCRGAALTRMFGVPTVWREYKHVSCPDFFARTLAEHRQFCAVKPSAGAHSFSTKERNY
ncbi:hypothetical protein KX763_25110, partial [Escherichia coli]|uniref:hypothetical protein n=1 Tax=Escherichia coli TaxID=562 RepID=UPI001C530BBF